MAALQVLQGSICDQGTVVQLDHLKVIMGTGAAAKMSDAIISDQLAVRQALQGHSCSSISQLHVLIKQELTVFKGRAHTHQDL